MKSEYYNSLFKRRGRTAPRHRQRGALTIFTGVFVLILMTLMLVYATRVGVFEQRVSSNEMRQKMAFHAAETALQQATEYLMGNRALANSSSLEAGSDGQATPGFRPGWFLEDPATQRWYPCPDSPAAGHPCGGGVAALAGSFYYDTDNDDSTRESLPINTGALAANTTARAMATVCILMDTDVPPDGVMDGCDADIPDADEGGGIILMTLMGYGYSDCEDVDQSGTIENDEIVFCKGEATVSIPLTSLVSVAGSGGMPLVTKNSLPTSGTAEVVPNPNGGGVGVPVSVWANGRSSGECPPKDKDGVEGDALDHADTSWATCEYNEWFGVDYLPDPLACDQPSCVCDVSELISGPVPSGETIISGDIQVDPAFPCDLFEFYFGVPSSAYELVKATAVVLDDCTSLNASSSGLIWVSGDTCTINSNTIVGSEDHPVMLVSAAAVTSVNGGAVIYGTLFITEVEVPDATFSANGGFTVFGQVVVDALFIKMLGTFQVVYNDAIISKVSGFGSLGTLNHGWRDWGLPDIVW